MKKLREQMDEETVETVAAKVVRKSGDGTERKRERRPRRKGERGRREAR